MNRYFLTMTMVVFSCVLAGCFGGTNKSKPTSYTVSGAVHDEQGQGIPDVVLVFSGESSTVTTDANGKWSKSGLWGNVTVTPTKTNYTFEPESRQIKESSSNVDFVGSVETPEPVQYILEIDVVGDGIVVREPKLNTFIEGAIVQLTAIPESGWTFSHWDGDGISTDNPVTLLMDSQKYISAIFTQDEYHLSVDVIGNGSVSLSPEQEIYKYGEKVELLATPELGWRFNNWQGNLAGSQNPVAIEIDNNKSITAVFQELEFKEIGVPYTTANGLTVIINDFQIIEKPGSFVYQINYTLRNDTPNRQLEAGAFTLFYKDKPGGLGPSGYYWTLFPGDSPTFTYSFESLKSNEFYLLQYHRNRVAVTEPRADGLNWKVEY